MSKIKLVRFRNESAVGRVLLRVGLVLLPAATHAAGPCDLYAAAGTPCVAAHSTTRALFAAYNGPLYQVRRTSDGTTKDIGLVAAGGVVKIATQDSFLNGKAGTISIIYDQTTNHNDLKKSGVMTWLKSGASEASATAGQMKMDGRTAYGIAINAYAAVAYSCMKTKAVATGNQAESIYMVVDGKRYSSSCCFDYGNSETTGVDDGNATMEALYWGTDVGWGGYGIGNGPWVGADLENGVFKGNAGGWLWGDTHKTPWPTALSVVANYATTMLKGPSDNSYKLKAGDAQNGKLSTMWDGTRPTGGYSPKKLEGAIILGTGGDGSNAGTGTFYEGAMTIGNPPDSVDDKVQANIVAAGYGRTTTSVLSRPEPGSETRLRYSPATSQAVVEYSLTESGRMELEVVDLRGNRICRVSAGEVGPGLHRVAWDASKASNGVYLARLLQNGAVAWSGTVMIDN
jgi:hypothetical protein